MNKKLKMKIVIARAIALITTILSIVFLQNLNDFEEIQNYKCVFRYRRMGI